MFVTAAVWMRDRRDTGASSADQAYQPRTEARGAETGDWVGGLGGLERGPSVPGTVPVSG